MAVVTACGKAVTPNLPTNIIPTKIRWLNTSGRFPMDMRIPPLTIRNLPMGISGASRETCATYQHQEGM